MLRGPQQSQGQVWTGLVYSSYYLKCCLFCPSSAHAHGAPYFFALRGTLA